MAVRTLTATPRLAPIFLRSALGGSKGGTALPDTTLRVVVPVDRQRLLAYQRMCGFPVGDTVPHTYPHVLGFPLQMRLMGGKDFPMPLAGVVHVENAIAVHRRITAADELEISVSAERLRPHAKGRQVDLVTAARVGGELVWEGRSTYLARGKGDPDAERSLPPAMPTGFPAAQWSLEGGLGRRYAAVSGDVNPIHLSALSARAMGFPKAIAHGMWTYARTLAAIGPETADPSTSQVWFKKPVLLPSRVDLVLAKGEGEVVAGLRNARRPETEHLVLIHRG